MASSHSEAATIEKVQGSLADALTSYLSPVLKSVGITAPVQITLINAGLGLEYPLCPTRGFDRMIC